MIEPRRQIQELLTAARLMLEQAREIAVANDLEFSFGTEICASCDYSNIPTDDEITVDWQSSSASC